MRIKVTIRLTLFLLFSLQIYSQKNGDTSSFVPISPDNLKMRVYDKDTTANALVIYEKGTTIIENKRDLIYLKTTVYRKIKIFNKEGEKHATVKIYVYNDDKNIEREKVKKIIAITHNLGEPPTYLNSEHIYTNKINNNWKEVIFTFPNIKPGSVIEYQYDLESKFFFNFSGWTFQSSIPKIYSKFHALIPGNWRYNRRLKGALKLSTNDSKIKKQCFSIGVGTNADCEELTYIMKDIPAFIEENEYSTTKDNYLSKIKFELAEIIYLDGTSKKYTTSWSETDKRLKVDENLGKLSKNSSFFLKNLPNDIIIIEDHLAKCMSVYKYIQNHFSLNKSKKSIFNDVDVKKAFKEKIGSISEINLALISSLKATGIDAKILLLATRDKGLPTKLHPVITDFNYLAALITIDDKNYLLDASDNNLSFNMLPFKALNSYGRVLDFKNGSYWLSTLPSINTLSSTDAILAMNEYGELKGNIKEINSGYYSKKKRDFIKEEGEEEYLSNREHSSSNLEIISYTNENIDNLENNFIENFKIESETESPIGKTIYLSPFIKKYTKNPFQLKQRLYPVNFGYKWNITYKIKILIPENLIVKTIPKDAVYQLPNNGGLFIASFKNKENEIVVYTKIKLNRSLYKTDDYQYIKELFNQIIKTQNSLIVLEET